MSSIELKEQLHEYIDKVDDRLLNLMLVMIEADFGNDERIRLEQYNKELGEVETATDEFYTQDEREKMAIEKGLKQIKEGKVKPHIEVMSKLRPRYSQ